MQNQTTIMILSFVIFTSILTCSIILQKIPVIATRKIYGFDKSIFNQINIFIGIWIPIIFASAVVGLRYEVGVDWYNYNMSYGIYKYATISDAFISFETYEWLFSCILIFLNHLKLPSFTMFILSTFISLIFYYKAYSLNPRVLPYGIFTLYTENAFFCS